MDIVAAFHAIEGHFLAATGGSGLLLRVNFGIGCMLAFQLVLGVRRGSWLALVFLSLCVVFHEAMDQLYYGIWHSSGLFMRVAAVMGWPLVLMLIARFRRWRWAALHGRQRQSMAVSASEGQSRPPTIARNAQRPVPQAKASFTLATAPTAIRRHLRVIPGLAAADRS